MAIRTCKLERQSDRRWTRWRLIRCHFLLQNKLSDSIEQYNEPPSYKLHQNFAKLIFVVQIHQTDARYGSRSRLTNLAERR